jgi:hypothetical protein
MQPERIPRQSAHKQLLAGLVSPEAERLYERLSARGRLRIGNGPDEIDMDQPAAAELADEDLLYGDPANADWIQAVSPFGGAPIAPITSPARHYGRPRPRNSWLERIAEGREETSGLRPG